MKKTCLLWFLMFSLLLSACSRLVTYSAQEWTQPVCLGSRSGLADSLSLVKEGEFTAETSRSLFQLFLFLPPMLVPLGGNFLRKDDLAEKYEAALAADPAKAITGLRIDTDSRMFFLSAILLNAYGEYERAAGRGFIKRVPDIPGQPEADHE